MGIPVTSNSTGIIVTAQVSWGEFGKKCRFDTFQLAWSAFEAKEFFTFYKNVNIIQLKGV